MKKGIVISLICLATGVMSHSVYADASEIKSIESEPVASNPIESKPIKLKRKCLKQHPLAENQTDQVLLGIYQQACDKKNAASVNDLLAQAAMRMYELKQPMNALSLATHLQKQNVRSTTLTDVTFLAGVAIANEAVEHMRSSEMRYLSHDVTYPPAKELMNNIHVAYQTPVASKYKANTDDESSKKEIRNTSTHNKKRRSTKSTRKTATSVAPVKRQTAVTPTVSKQSNVVQKVGSNPFVSLR